VPGGIRRVPRLEPVAACRVGEFDPAKIARWRRDAHGPEYEATIRLLEVAGLLRKRGNQQDL